MSVSNIEKNVFKCLECFHFYLWPFPVQWNANYTELCISKPLLKYCGPSAFFLLITMLYALSCFCTACYIHFRYNAERIEVLVLLLICGTLSIVVYGFIYLSLNASEILLTFNGLIRMASEIERGKVSNFLLNYNYYSI